MRVIVCGSRYWIDADLVYRELDRLHKRFGIGEVIEGDQRGVDRMAGYWARRNKIHNRKFPADVKQWGRAAYPYRNQQMADESPDACIAFPGGKGTADMVRRAHAAGIKVIEPLASPRAAAPEEG